MLQKEKVIFQIFNSYVEGEQKKHKTFLFIKNTYSKMHYE